jgi:hypothetical protein
VLHIVQRRGSPFFGFGGGGGWIKVPMRTLIGAE